jgi:hypothetical protein
VDFVGLAKIIIKMKTEKIIAIILVIGLILRFFHIPGGSIFTILSMSILSLLYFPFGFYFLSDKKIDNRTIAFSVLSGMVLSIALLGALFKIMHWPGASFMLVFGLAGCIPVAILSYLNHTKPKSEELVLYYKNVFVRVLIVIILGLLSFIF